MTSSFPISREDSGYPESLRQIHDPPKQLWWEGDVSCLSGPIVIAIVGSRECTSYGQEVAFELAKDLARSGAVIVSGLAYGIDTAAHRGALEGGGKTIGVLGCGIDIDYPAGNRELKKRITHSGAFISEFAPGTRATSWTFPQRNRIISGLSQGVVVVEAGLKSGSLITADFALQQGREVFAVPGNIRSPMSEGTHRLIQNGAKLVTSAKDILEELRLPMNLFPKETSQAFSDEEKRVLNLLLEGPLHMDALCESSGLPVDKMSSVLVELEINGRIRSLPGSRFERSMT